MYDEKGVSMNLGCSLIGAITFEETISHPGVDKCDGFGGSANHEARVSANSNVVWWSASYSQMSGNSSYSVMGVRCRRW